MSSTYRGQVPAGTAPAAAVGSLLRRVSWGAIFAGAIVALAVGLMLNVLGAAVGATLVDATARSTPNASSFGIGAGVWLLVSNLIGLGLGGYVAARLSGTASSTDATLHGMTMWATSFLISAVLLGNLVSGVASTATNGIASAVGGIARGAGSVASTAGEQVANRTSTGTIQSATQSIIDRAQNALSGTGNPPASMTSDQRKAEMATLVGRRVTDGNLSAPDRERLNALVAAEYNISPQDAQQRVTQAEQQAQQAVQQAEQRAREAADAAAKGASVASFSIFLTMLLGLVAAVVGARRGTRDHAVAYGTTVA
ncbi:hypothetical protein [Roseomonas haemaphysalidis]|uniref:hypothetical protein n=1 Tax=Roseomonas haemaphysalidis TaxID=2768162 RepID=UPI001F2F8D49|nr:hypothetical protein [Roseomonas haemaphysalidis]